MSLDTFEESLLVELRQHVAARSAAVPRGRRRGAAVVAGGAVAAATVALGLALGSGVVAPSAAYAVDTRADGDLVVTVRDLSDAAGLEAALATHGIHATIAYERGYSQAAGESPTTGGGSACDIALAKTDGGLRFILDARQIASHGQLHIVTSGST